MANRSANEKKLVNAIVDGEVAAKALATKAAGFGAALGLQLTTISKAIVAARVAGHLSPDEAKARFREAYIALTLAGFVEVAQEVVDHSSQVAQDIHVHAKAAGAEARKVAPVRKADFLAREIEKKQTNG